VEPPGRVHPFRWRTRSERMTVMARGALLTRAVRWSSLALVLAVLGAAGTAFGEGLEQFTGYTRPGTQVDKKAGGVHPAAANGKLPDTIGITVYFQVYERDGRDPRDPWGTGMEGLAERFVPGKGSPVDERRLDTAARYFYLYQICNDSGRPGLLRLASI